MSLDAKLRKAKGHYDKAKADPEWGKGRGGGGFEKLPPGIYIAQITTCELGESQSSGRLRIKWEYTVLKGEQQGKAIYVFQGIETDLGWDFAVSAFKKFGVDADGPEEMKAACEYVEGGEYVVRLNLTYKGDDPDNQFTNVRVKKIISSNTEETPPEDEETFDDDDTPPEEEETPEEEPVEEDPEEEEEEPAPKPRKVTKQAPRPAPKPLPKQVKGKQAKRR